MERRGKALLSRDVLCRLLEGFAGAPVMVCARVRVPNAGNGNGQRWKTHGFALLCGTLGRKQPALFW